MNQAIDKIRENDQQNLQKNMPGIGRNIMGALGQMGGPMGGQVGGLMGAMGSMSG